MYEHSSLLPPATNKKRFLTSAPQLKRSNSDSDMKVANKLPRFATKYDEMLQPLSPVTTLPVATKSPLSIHKTHQSTFDAKLQRQFQNLLGFASNVSDIEDFLSKHSENVDLNEYNEVTALKSFFIPITELWLY
jgi:hypothetical protein